MGQSEEGWPYWQPIKLRDWSYFGRGPLLSTIKITTFQVFLIRINFGIQKQVCQSLENRLKIFQNFGHVCRWSLEVRKMERWKNTEGIRDQQLNWLRLGAETQLCSFSITPMWYMFKAIGACDGGPISKRVTLWTTNEIVGLVVFWAWSLTLHRSLKVTIYPFITLT